MGQQGPSRQSENGEPSVAGPVLVATVQLQLRSMLSDTETQVWLTQGARAPEWPPAPRPPA